MNRVAWAFGSLVCLLALALVVLVFHGGIVFRAGDNIVELMVEGLFWGLCVSLGVSVFASTRENIKRLLKLQYLIIALAGFVALRFAVLGVMQEESLRLIYSRAAYVGMSDDGILVDLTANNKYYPTHEFIMEARERIPEDDGVLYLGDLRGDPVNYLLYPRRVYMYPELQDALNRNILKRWSLMDDPGWVGREDSFEEGASLQPLLKEPEIEWVIEYDSLNPERRRIYQLGGQQ